MHVIVDSAILGIKVDTTSADALAKVKQRDIKRAYYKLVSVHTTVLVLGIY